MNAITLGFEKCRRGCEGVPRTLRHTASLDASAASPPDLTVLSNLRDNFILLAVALLLTWTLAAFGEELVWRGYILNRIADVISLPRLRWPIAVALSSAAFGLAHFDQRWTGILENAIDGALLAGQYFASGRNLWLPIIAHGVTDSIDSLLIFSGHYPTK